MYLVHEDWKTCHNNNNNNNNNSLFMCEEAVPHLGDNCTRQQLSEDSNGLAGRAGVQVMYLTGNQPPCTQHIYSRTTPKPLKMLPFTSACTCNVVLPRNISMQSAAHRRKPTAGHTQALEEMSFFRSECGTIATRRSRQTHQSDPRRSRMIWSTGQSAHQRHAIRIYSIAFAF